MIRGGFLHLHQPCSNSPTPCLQLHIEVVKVDGLAHPGVVDKAEEREADKLSVHLRHLMIGHLKCVRSGQVNNIALEEMLQTHLFCPVSMPLDFFNFQEEIRDPPCSGRRAWFQIRPPQAPPL